MDRRFVKQFGGPDNEQILVLPLVLKEKVAALLYADGGSSAVLDATSLEVLVMTTSAWLEVTSLRKQAQDRGWEVRDFSRPVRPKRRLSERIPSRPEPSRTWAIAALVSLLLVWLAIRRKRSFS